jgi:hypothetical protein
VEGGRFGREFFDNVAQGEFWDDILGFVMPSRNQRPKNTPWRERPFDNTLIDLSAPWRGVYAAGKELK